ncbi:hypothetical protein niasHT_030622 [Heterodera trifolii]|uniref:Ku domain-containing protein n=1 Tax=Heterodera trifolii TaxID=157864 RepID=A0ABD2HPW4_9BILA
MDDSNGQQQWEGEQQSIVYEGGKKGRIFVINYGAEMFAGNGFRFRMALQAVRNQISDICCMGNWGEMCAVVFANTERTNDKAENIDNMFVFREMGTMDAEFVKGLDDLLSGSDLRQSLDTFLGGSGICNWAELLYLCQKLLRYGHQFRKKFIHIFTTDQERMSSKTMDQMRSRLDEIGNAGIDVGVFLMDDPGIAHEEEQQNEKNAAMSNFWAEVDPSLSRFSSPAELQSGLRLKNYALRSTTSLPFKMGDNFEFAVGLYYLIKPQGKPPAVMMDTETGERIEQRVHYLVAPREGEAPEETPAEEGREKETPADEVFEGELGFSRQVGGVEVVLSRAELEKLRRLEKPGIVVIGFKPLHLLKDSHRMGAAVFVYPIESVISGSSALYRALLKRCLDKQLFVLVRYTHKTNTPPKLCALVPQSADQIPSGCTLAREYFYDGFHLVEIPFAEKSRSMEKRLLPPEGGIGTWPLANADQVEAAKQFVKKLTNTKFSPDDFANPVLQQHYKAVEMVALDLPFDSEQFKKEAAENDKLIPYFKNPTFEQRVAKELEEFAEICETIAETKEKGKRKSAKTEKEEEEREEKEAEEKRGTKKRKKRGETTDGGDEQQQKGKNGKGQTRRIKTQRGTDG